MAKKKENIIEVEELFTHTSVTPSESWPRNGTEYIEELSPPIEPAQIKASVASTGEGMVTVVKSESLSAIRDRKNKNQLKLRR